MTADGTVVTIALPLLGFGSACEVAAEGIGASTCTSGVRRMECDKVSMK